MEIIDIKEFAKAALDEHVEAFTIYVTSFLTIIIHPARKVQIVLLVTEKINILTKYSDFSDVFSKKKASILPEVIKLNQHAIKLQNGQQLLYRPIYSLG